MKEDIDVWEDFKNGVEYALPSIYNQNVDFLFCYGKKFTIDEDFILDMIHDLFCDLIKYREKLGENDNIRLYLMKSLRRKLLKGLESKRKITKLDKGYDSASQIVFSIEEEIIKGEDRSRRTKYLKQGLQELNAKQREILYYKFTLGYDYPQICEIMTITYDSARQSVSRAIYSLKQFVSKNNFILMLFWR